MIKRIYDIIKNIFQIIKMQFIEIKSNFKNKIYWFNPGEKKKVTFNFFVKTDQQSIYKVNNNPFEEWVFQYESSIFLNKIIMNLTYQINYTSLQFSKSYLLEIEKSFIRLLEFNEKIFSTFPKNMGIKTDYLTENLLNLQKKNILIIENVFFNLNYSDDITRFS